MPQLSIITINYNNFSGLGKTMTSVFAQHFTGYEYIVIDGGSTDGSKELIRDHSNRFAYWISEPDKGIYDAMNKGIQQAKGDYIMFLNSGDHLLGEAVLKNSFAIIEKDPLDIYYGDIEIEFPGKGNIVMKHPPILNLDFLEDNTLNHQASFIKTTLFKELGLYNTRYSMAADYAFYLKAFISGKSFKHIDEVMVHYPWDGCSSNNEDQYILQMKTVWKDIVPGYIDSLYRENKEYRNNRKRVFIRMGKTLDRAYQSIKALMRIRGGK